MCAAALFAPQRRTSDEPGDSEDVDGAPPLEVEPRAVANTCVGLPPRGLQLLERRPEPLGVAKQPHLAPHHVADVEATRRPWLECLGGRLRRSISRTSTIWRIGPQGSRAARSCVCPHSGAGSGAEHQALEQ